MTLHLPSDATRAAVLKAIDAQLAPTPEEHAVLSHTSDAQALLQKLLELRDDVTIAWPPVRRKGE